MKFSLIGIALAANVNSTSGIESRSLADPNCFAKSYLAGTEYTFSAFINPATNKTFESILDLAIHLGPAWDGHRLFCTDLPDTNTIVNSFNETLRIDSIPAPLVKRQSDTQPPLKQYDSILNSTKTPPKCLPLVSQHPGMNPYHPLLTPPNSNTRKVRAFPIIINDTITTCSVAQGKCVVRLSKTVTITKSNSYSVSDGSSDTLSKTFGNSTSKSLASNLAKEISNMLDVSYSLAATNANGGSLSQSLSDALTITHDLQAANTKVRGSTRDATSSRTSDVNEQTSWNNELSNTKSEEERKDMTDSWGVQSGKSTDWGHSIEVSVGFQGTGSQYNAHVNQQVSSGQTKDHATLNSKGSSSSQTNSNLLGGFIGKSNSITDTFTDGHSESDSLETRRSDSISDAKTSTTTTDKNWSNSLSDTVGNSKSQTVGSTQGFTSTDNYENQRSETYNLAKTTDIQRSTSQEYATSDTISRDFEVAGGSTGAIAMFLLTESAQIPFICLGAGGKEILYTAEVAEFYDKLSQSNYDVGLIANIDTDRRFEIRNEALSTRVEYSQSNNPTSLQSGVNVIIKPGSTRLFEVTVLSTKTFKLVVTQFGNMLLKQGDTVKWQTHTTVYRSTDVFEKDPLTGLNRRYASSPIRLRVTEFGHIILEAAGMFKNQPYSPFNETIKDPQVEGGIFEDYTIIWSNVPKHMRYQLGVLKTGYNLLIEDKQVDGSTGLAVDLVLYDGGGSAIWCALYCNSPVPQGFRFPDNFLIPTDIPTESSNTAEFKDLTPHNTIDQSITFIPGSTFLSDFDKCGPVLVSGQGFKSPNGRFKLYLQNSGNLVLKDGTRTMWESMTSDLWFAKPPYKMTLSSRGLLYVTDSYNKLIVTTVLSKMVKKSTYLSLEDSGEFTIRLSENGSVVTNYFSNPEIRIFTSPMFACNANCTTCAPVRPANIKALYSDGADYTESVATLGPTDMLCSESQTHCVKFASYSNGSTNVTSLGMVSNGSYFPIRTFDSILKNATLGFDLDGRLQFFTTFGNQSVLYWNSTNEINGIGPFNSSISDTGRWSVFDAFNTEVWFGTGGGIAIGESCKIGAAPCLSGVCCESENESGFKCRVNESACKVRPPIRPLRITKLWSNGSDFTPFVKGFTERERLCSDSGDRFVLFANRTTLGLSGPGNTFFPIQKFVETSPDLSILFDVDGRLKVFSSGVNSPLWNNTNQTTGIPPFTSNLSNEGRWSVFDKSGTETWFIEATVPLGGVCNANGPSCNGNSICCLDRPQSRKVCQAKCTSLLDDGDTCNGMTDTCKNGSTCCFGDGDLVSKCRPLNSCLSERLYSVSNPSSCITISNKTQLKLSSCDDSQFLMKNGQLVSSYDRSKCISGLAGVTQVLVPCTSAAYFTFNKFQDLSFRLFNDDKLALADTGVIGDGFVIKEAAQASSSTTQYSFSIDDVKSTYTFSELFLKNQPGICLLLQNSSLITSYCDVSSKFALVDFKLVHSKSSKTCVSRNGTENSLTLLPCNQASNFTFNLLNDGAIRLQEDEKYAITVSSFGQKVVLSKEKSIVLQDLTFANSSIPENLFSNIFDINLPGTCISVKDNLVIVGECANTKFAFVESRLVFGQDVFKCISGETDGSGLRLIPCTQAGSYINNSTEKTFRLSTAPHFVLQNNGQGNSVTLFNSLEGENVKEKQQFSFNEKDFNPNSFTNIYDINAAGKCFVVSNSIIQYDFCDDSKFAIVGSRLVYNKNITLCVSGNLELQTLYLEICSKALEFLFNSLQDSSIRLKSNPSRIIGSSGTTKLTLGVTEEGTPATMQQQFSLHFNDVRFGYIYSLSKPGRCLSVRGSDIVNGFCEDAQFSFVQEELGGSGLLVYKENITQCIGAVIPTGTFVAPLKLVSCKDSHRLNLQYTEDGAFRVSDQPQWRINDFIPDNAPSVISLSRRPDLEPTKDEIFSFDQYAMQPSLFQRIYNVAKPSMCINVDRNLNVVNGFCDWERFAFVSLGSSGVGRLSYNDNTSLCVGLGNELNIGARLLKLVPCSQGILFFNDKSTKFFRRASDRQWRLDDNGGVVSEPLLMVSTDPTGSRNQQFTFSLNEVNDSLYNNIYHFNQVGMCLSVVDYMVHVDWCGEHKFAFVSQPRGIFLVYNQDPDLCISYLFDSFELSLTYCGNAEPFSYNKNGDNAIRLASNEKCRVTSNGDIGAKARLVCDETDLSSYVLKIQDSNLATVQAMYSEYRPGVCFNVHESGMIFVGFCNSNRLSFLKSPGSESQGRLVHIKEKMSCVTSGADGPMMGECSNAMVFVYNQYLDNTLRWAGGDGYSTGDYGNIGDRFFFFGAPSGGPTGDKNFHYVFDSAAVNLETVRKRYDFNKPGICLAKSASNGLTTTFCSNTESKFLYYNDIHGAGYLVDLTNANEMERKCWSASRETKMMILESCDKALHFTYHELNDMAFRTLINDDHYILDASGPIGSDISIKKTDFSQSVDSQFSDNGDYIRTSAYVNIYDYNRPGFCVGVVGDRLSLSVCGEHRFGYVITSTRTFRMPNNKDQTYNVGYLVYNKDTSKCVSGNNDSGVKLVPCKAFAAQYSYNKQGDNAYRLENDDTMILEHDGEINGYFVLTRTVSNRQRFLFEKTSFDPKLFNRIYNYRYPGICLVLNNQKQLVRGFCDAESLFLYVVVSRYNLGYLVYRYDTANCLSGVNGQVQLVACKDAGMYSYDNFFFRESENFDRVIADREDIGGVAFITTQRMSQYTFSPPAMQQIGFRNIYAWSKIGQCLTVDSSLKVVLAWCDDVQFHFAKVNNVQFEQGYFMYSKDLTKCIGRDDMNLVLVPCLSPKAQTFLYNMLADKSLRLSDQTTLAVFDSGTIGKQASLWYTRTPTTASPHQQFAFSQTPNNSPSFQLKVRNDVYLEIRNAGKDFRLQENNVPDTFFSRFSLVAASGCYYLVSRWDLTQCLGSEAQLVPCANGQLVQWGDDLVIRKCLQLGSRLDSYGSNNGVAYFRVENDGINDNQRFSRHDEHL